MLNSHKLSNSKALELFNFMAEETTTETTTTTTTTTPKWVTVCSWLSTSLAAIAAWVSASTFSEYTWAVVAASVLSATAKLAGKIYADRTDDGKLNWSTGWF